jgi:DNA polymerase-1
LLGASEVEAKWGVPPEWIPDVLALTGDSVDNIPGVEGVGPKTAAKLVLEHGGVAKLLGEISAIKNEKLRAKVETAAPRVRDNMELVRLDDALPLPMPVKNLRVTPDVSAVIALAKKCEFRSLLAEYEKLANEKSRGSQGELF